jgi:hypothetical protein
MVDKTSSAMADRGGARQARVLRRFRRRIDAPAHSYAAGRVLQVEPHGAVVVDDNQRIVTKSYFGDDRPTLLKVAATEFERQDKFWRSLQANDVISCPRPLELIEAPCPQIRMEFARGRPISTHLRDVELSPAELEWLADVLVGALASYVRTTKEPYYDFHLRNMLYSSSDRRVSFVDFGIPQRLEHSLHELGDLSPFEISLGNLVAGVVFESARPRSFYRLRQHRQALRLCSALLERSLDVDGGGVDLGKVRQAANVAYMASVYWGPAVRQGWYRLLGPLLARRFALRGVRFGPAVA